MKETALHSAEVASAPGSHARPMVTANPATWGLELPQAHRD